MATELTMPQMGYDMQEGTVVRWLKAEGSNVDLGEPVAEIETDKAVVEFESYASGVLREILVAEGSTVPVGEAIAVVGESASATAPPAPEPEPAGEGESAQDGAPAEDAPEGGGAEQGEEPAAAIPLGAASEPVAAESVADAPPETEPAAEDLSPPTPPRRVLATPIARQMARDAAIDLADVAGSGPGGRIVREDVLAVMESMRAPETEPEPEPAEEPPAAEQPAAEAEPPQAVEPAEEEQVAEPEEEPEPEPAAELEEEVAAAEPEADEAVEEAVAASVDDESEPDGAVEPAVAESEPLEAVEEAVAESGEPEPVEAVEEAVAASDEPEDAVEEAVAESEDEPEEEAVEAVAAASEDEPEDADAAGDLLALSRTRRQIARVTIRSKSEKPHFYVNSDVDMTAAMALRAQINEALAADGVRVTVNDMIIAASVIALKRFPKFNAYYEEGGIRMNDDVNVGVAMALEEGLIMPAIVGAGGMSLREIAQASKDLSERAQRGSLSAREYSGGTFAVSNMGMMGVTSFVAIIQPPQSAVLAIGAVQKRAVVSDDDQIAIRQMMTATLSADHRIVDGAEGALFVNEIKNLLENPLSVIL